MQQIKRIDSEPLLLHGDFRKFLFDGTIKPNSIDLTVTSPPYDNLRTYNHPLAWGWPAFSAVSSGLWEATKPGGVVVWVVGDATIKGDETGTSFNQVAQMKRCGFLLHDTMIYEKLSVGMYDPRNMRYKSAFEFMFVFSKGKPATYNPIKDKPNKNPGRSLCRSNGRTNKGALRRAKHPALVENEFQDRFNVWAYYTGNNLSTKDKIAFGHPAIFPERLAHDHIISWSNEADTVLDPMMGSGTTGKMAKLLRRKFIGIEIDSEYYQIATKRIEAY
jgi:DNA modification methylase